MKKTLLIALVSLLLVAGTLWATDGTWLYPIPTLGGITAGDVIIVDAAGLRLTNNSRIRLLAATPPTCAATYAGCGTTHTIRGNDSAGVITLGGTVATTLSLTFNTAWTAAPSCLAQKQTGTAGSVVQQVDTGTTTMNIIVATGVATNDRIAYQCMGTA